MMKTRIAIPLLLVAVASLLAAGCGGGKSRNAAYAGSKTEFAKALDSICAATNEAGKSLDLSSMSALAANGDQAQELLSSMAEKIDNLEPPDEVKTQTESFVEGLRNEADKFGEVTQAAKDGDEDKVKSLQSELQSDSAATSEDARFIGAEGCARLFS